MQCGLQWNARCTRKPPKLHRECLGWHHRLESNQAAQTQLMHTSTTSMRPHSRLCLQLLGRMGPIQHQQHTGAGALLEATSAQKYKLPRMTVPCLSEFNNMWQLHNHVRQLVLSPHLSDCLQFNGNWCLRPLRQQIGLLLVPRY